MELNTNLHILIERACALQDRVNDEILGTDCTTSFCRLCSEHGRYCGIAETPFEERQRLIGIRDSLKDVENMLVFAEGKNEEECPYIRERLLGTRTSTFTIAQAIKGSLSSGRLQSDQHKHRLVALERLKESRLLLIEKLNQFLRNGRKLDVIEHLNANFGDARADSSWNFKDKTDEQIESKVENNKSCFIVGCIKKLLSPWHWHKTALIAIKLMLISVCISSTYNFYQKEYINSKRKVISSFGSAKVGAQGLLLTASNSPLDVFHGKG
ncbi:hypothetical protein RJ639_043608 [Escallonia herrerae]|uniref:Uncharacterized protein n=1 Tax=Escallonia herrerae TaxID=1293975 RepID=A0AA88WC62_9ASTE|nr:hypothetical protein RJ639_043608 [Escallonia herrerae]